MNENNTEMEKLFLMARENIFSQFIDSEEGLAGMEQALIILMTIA
ncbi:hypothetical protein [Alkalibacter rhizosphaerae]|nr:hypothetical protein [Alkalibacter rhizosphaerae]